MIAHHGALDEVKDVQEWPHAGIVVEQACRHAHCLEIRNLTGKQRAAGSVEVANAAGRGFVTVDQLFAGEPAELCFLHVGKGAEACCGQLAAVLAMTMSQRADRVDLETNTTTGAATPGSLALLIDVRIS